MSYDPYNYGYYGQPAPAPPSLPPASQQDLYGPTYVDPKYTLNTPQTTQNQYSSTNNSTYYYQQQQQQQQQQQPPSTADLNSAYTYPYAYGADSSHSNTTNTLSSSYNYQQQTTPASTSPVPPSSPHYGSSSYYNNSGYDHNYNPQATTSTNHTYDYAAGYNQQSTSNLSASNSQYPATSGYNTYDQHTPDSTTPVNNRHSQGYQYPPTSGYNTYDQQTATNTYDSTNNRHSQGYQYPPTTGYDQQTATQSYDSTTPTNNRHSQGYQYPPTTGYDQQQTATQSYDSTTPTNNRHSQGYQYPPTTGYDQQQLTQQQQQEEYQRQKDLEEQWRKYYEQQKQYEEQWRQYYENQNKEMERIKQQQKEEQDKMEAQLQKERDEVERLKREAAQKYQQGEEEKQKILIWQQEEMKRQMNELNRERELARKHEEEVRRAIIEEQKQQQQKLDEQQNILRQQQDAINRKLYDDEMARQRAEAAKAEEIKKQEAALQKKKEDIDSLFKKFDAEKTQELSLAASRKNDLTKQKDELAKRNEELAKEKEAIAALKQKQEQERNVLKVEFEKNRQIEQAKLKEQQDAIKREQELLNIQRKDIQIQSQQATIDSLQPMRDMVAAINLNQKSGNSATVQPSTLASKKMPARQAPLPPGAPQPAAPVAPQPAAVTVVAKNSAPVVPPSPATKPNVQLKPMAVPVVTVATVASPFNRSARFSNINLSEVANINGTHYKVGDVVKIQRCFRKWSTRKKFRNLVELQKRSNDPEIENAKKRFRAVNEVYTTEVSYLNSLLILQNFYFIPMEVEAKVTKAFKSEEIGKVFSNLKSLLQLSNDFHHELEKRLNTFPIMVGDVFLKFAPIFKIYVEYVNNFDQVTPKLNVMMETPQGASFFAEQKKKSRSSNDIQSLLIMPVQRVPRYELLLREILSHTPESHAEYKSIKTAHESMKGINKYINERKKNVDSRSKLLELQKEIKNAPELLASHRYYVRELPCHIASTKKNESGNFYLYIFNDSILVTKKAGVFSSHKHEYSFTIPLLGDTDVNDIESKDSMVRVVYGNLSSVDVVIYTLCFNSNKDKDLFLADLKSEVSTKSGMVRIQSTASLGSSIKN